MKRLSVVALVLAGCAAALPASAQYGRVEKTQAEIAFEQAETNFAAQRELRQKSNTECAANNYDACLTAGDSYRKGTGGAQDHGLALKAYERACKGRNGKGCASQAYMVLKGRGLDADPASARSLYRQSCDYGEVSGCAAYGNMVYTGTGGAKNVTQGTDILRDACNRDYRWACDRLNDLGAFDPTNSTYERLRDLRGG